MTSDELKFARDGQLSFGRRSLAPIPTVFRFKRFLPNGNYLTDDGAGGEIEWRPHGSPVVESSVAVPGTTEDGR